MAVIIDTDSAPGSWATAIAHTPHPAAQTRDHDGVPPQGCADRAGGAGAIAIPSLTPPGHLPEVA